MFDIIIATTYISRGIYGIGLDGKLPWYSSEELNIFMMKTYDNIVIMGRKTVENLPKLKNRTIICLSSKKIEQNVLDSYNNNVIVCKSLHQALNLPIIIENTSKKIIIAGGGKLYEEVFTKWYNFIDTIHMSMMKKSFRCDTFVNFDHIKFTVECNTIYNDFVHYVLNTKQSEESIYLSLLEDVYKNGSKIIGRNGNTFSLFGKTIEFDMRNGFPLLTTKNMFFRGIVEELLFFIRGDTDTKILENKKINIWNGNTNRQFLDSINKKERREGVMGPMYGYQWRYFNVKYDDVKASPSENNDNRIDQLVNVIKKLRTDPNSRRILLSNFNPLQAEEGVLFPCHSIIIQFYVNDGYLDMFCYNRSSDLFHGLPFNIASSSLLLLLIAKITNLIPRKFILSLGDCHIYEEHINVVETQLARIPFKFPILEINKDIKEIEDIEKLQYSDFTLFEYKSYPTLKAKMIA